MPNQKHQETPTTSLAFEKVEQPTDPYRRHDKRMDRSLLLREVEFVNKALTQATQPGTLLDLCCGVGEVSLMLHTTGFRSLGLDKNLLALKEFRQHSQEVPLIQGDALYLPFWNQSFDVIVALHCFDLLDRARFLQECNRVLCGGGLLIFDALNRYSYKMLLKRLIRFLGPLFPSEPSNNWIDVFSFQEMRQIIGQAGFDIASGSGYGWSPFSVSSNNRMVNACTSVERVLRLDHLTHVSPRIVMVVRKKPNRRQAYCNYYP